MGCRARHERTNRRTNRELAVLSFLPGCEQPLRNNKNILGMSSSDNSIRSMPLRDHITHVGPETFSQVVILALGSIHFFQHISKSEQCSDRGGWVLWPDGCSDFKIRWS